MIVSSLKNSFTASALSIANRLPLLDVIAGLLIGSVIGYVGWGGGRSPEVAVLLPIVISLGVSRRQAFAIGFAYILAVGRGIPAFGTVWFANALYGWSLTLAFSLIGGLAWMTSWTRSTSPVRKAIATSLGFLLTLLPPICAVVPGQVLIAWGFLLPGWKWAGLGVAIVLPSVFIWHVHRERMSRSQIFIVVALFAMVLGAESLRYVPRETRYVNDIVGVNTKWGVSKSPYDIVNRVEKIGHSVKAFAVDHMASVVVYPESILQVYDPSIFPVLDGEVLDPAAAAGQTVILGFDMPVKGGNFQTAALAFYPDRKVEVAVARQTVPFALWRPWQKSGSFESDWTANNTLPLNNGLKARVLFCYEEYIPFLALMDERVETQITIVMANTWADKSGLASAIQKLHSEGMALLFGRHLVRSANAFGELLQSVPIPVDPNAATGNP